MTKKKAARKADTPESYAEIRRALGSQTEVGAMLGVSLSTMQRREAKGGAVSREAELAILALAPGEKNPE